MKRVIVLFGPPTSGKGTQARLLSKKLNLKHFSTGDALRREMSLKTEIGRKIEKVVNKGELISDTLITQVLKHVLEIENALEEGFILDGFPRTEKQVYLLEEVLENMQDKKLLVLYLNISPKTIMERFEGRRICKKCTASYHIKFFPSKIENKCDKCGSELYRRKDDDKESVKRRIDAYDKQVCDILSIYREKGMLEEINAEKSADAVLDSILRIL